MLKEKSNNKTENICMLFLMVTLVLYLYMLNVRLVHRYYNKGS